MSSGRAVPRHIDAPNRIPEFVITYIVVFYTAQWIFHEGMFSLGITAVALYLMYKYTLDKPEGLMMRMIYRKIQIGKMRPTPAAVKKLEIN